MNDDDIQTMLDQVRAQTLADALLLIAGEGCEHYTRGPGYCTRTERTPDALGPDARWCNPCIAWRALYGGPAIRYIDGRILGPGAVKFTP